MLVDHPQPHPSRARTILQAHPEARQLLGHNPWSAVWLIGIVALQCTIALLVTPLPWWSAPLVAWFVGAYLNHALWVLVHECTHNLIFRRRSWNRWMALIANLPMAIPMTVGFSVYHIKHHMYLGHCDHDADVAPRWEGWLLRGGFWGRLAWSCLFPLLQALRPLKIKPRNEPTSWSKWLWPNILIQAVFCGAWFWMFGWKGLYYMVSSAYFAIGAHPLVARYIQEHYVFQQGQETGSYYGVFNLFAFNIGYHNEHHDLPQVPWNRLPLLKRLAPEMYDGLYAHRSWLRLWVRFLFDRELDAYRIARGD